MQGEIAKLVLSKNYGFIRSKDGEEIFFHKSDLSSGIVFEALEKGDPVRFFVEDSEKGKKATNIIKSN